MPNEELELAFRRLVRARDLLEQQKELIARRSALGCLTEESKQLLKQMEIAVAGFQRYLRHARSESSPTQSQTEPRP